MLIESTTIQRNKPEAEILVSIGLDKHCLPESSMASQLVDLYWLHVHPQFPILVRTTFERHFAHGTASTALLFAIYALASCYDDSPGVVEYVKCATRRMAYDSGSTLANVQTYLLLSYRQIGAGANSESQSDHF